MNFTLIEINNVSVTYDGVEALKDVSLKINDGEFVFVVGENGAGKSTLIKLLIRDVKPDHRKDVKSSMFVNGFDLVSLKQRRVTELRRTIGFVFQDYKLIPNLSVYDNVAFVLRSIDAPNRYIRKRVPQVIALMGLKDKIRNMPHELSGGEQQRVAIARAIAKNPKLLLCDEPTGALDYATGKQILQLLQDTCRKENMTVLIITHNSALAPMADKVIRFKSGRVTDIVVNEHPTPIEEIEW